EAPKLAISYNGTWVGRQPSPIGKTKKGYTVHNLSARWADAADISGLTVTLGVDNLFDATYSSHASQNGSTNHPRFGRLELDDIEPGRNIKLTVAQTF
ncbi:MAG: hypothetical protein ACK41P_03180, partial [Asticcacaulis sp.]